MSASTAIGVGDLDWVLVLAPYRRDGAFIEALLVEHAMSVKQSLNEEEFRSCLMQSPGVVVVTHEALTPEVIDAITLHQVAQPSWAELPVVVLLDRSAAHDRIRSHLDRAWPRGRQIYYQRPVAALELVSGIQSAFAIRGRQKEVRDHLEKELEFRLELNHRVKNILASVTSIFQMTRRKAGSVDQLGDDFEGRLRALGDVHSAVFQAGGTNVSLKAVIDLTVLPYGSGGESLISVHGPDVTITRDAGTTLALCLHELATNAIKYGALSKAGGKVMLTWTLVDTSEPALEVEWRESGGPAVSKPTRAGYGTRYIHSALATVFGQPPVMDYLEGGLVCTVSGSLKRLTQSQALEQ